MNTRRWITYQRWFPRWPHIGLFGYWGEPVTYEVIDHGNRYTKVEWIRRVNS